MKERVEKRLVDKRFVRRIRDGFSWIDRRFVGAGWIERLEIDEIALYFFLVTVADRDGLSFYSDGRMATTLKIAADRLACARTRLLELGLIAWEKPLYQVLDLPASLVEGRRRVAR